MVFASFRILLLGFILIGSARSQTLQDMDFILTRYGMEHGLPQNTINDMLQAKNGYIWLATFGGLVRFDGNSFTTFDR